MPEGQRHGRGRREASKKRLTADHELRFAVKLALAHGRSISEVLRYPSWELTYWQAYYQIDPFGNERLDYNCANIAYHSTQVHVKQKLDPEKFVPKFGVHERDNVPVNQIEAQFKALAKSKKPKPTP